MVELEVNEEYTLEDIQIGDLVLDYNILNSDNPVLGYISSAHLEQDVRWYKIHWFDSSHSLETNIEVQRLKKRLENYVIRRDSQITKSW